MANFDERAGIISAITDWGQWWQTIEEVYIEIAIPTGTSVKEIKCEIRPKHIKVAVKSRTVVEGTLFSVVRADDSIWTFEDKKILRICLVKADATAKNCWRSLLVDSYVADPVTFDEMEKKLTLQRFQLENPGLDFSGATVDGNYHGGGPELPS
ncbi:nudC domain-containing protein 2-like [Ylistrum balloti]|uniref:nudC domain-containing protein 2-like n=1 Tax=Ylistrum balloti TaxID=509963 RepID=UPI002905854B|nr:nudC domain-containing protein 2-like [Ylistrum balloti]